MKSSPRIIFYGTPDFALATLKLLREKNCNIAAVVTAPDRPAGRGLQTRPSPVSLYAAEHSLPVLKPEHFSDPEFMKILKTLEPDLQIVVAFRMLPRPVWALPPLGTFNLHASLLPQYRGAAPINWAVINGEKETGLTTFFLQEKVDTGDIILQKRLSIGAEETAGELHDRMKVEGAKLVVETIAAICGKGKVARSQSELIVPGTFLKPAPKIFTSHCRINWTMTAVEIFNQIRGLSPSPAAFTDIRFKDGTFSTMKILRAGLETPGSGRPGGTMSTNGKNWLRFSAADGDINIYELQVSGRKVMTAGDFLRGSGRNIL